MTSFDNMIDMLYNTQYPNGLTSEQINEKESEKKYIRHIKYLSDIFDGYINYSVIGVIFLTFPSKGLKPENTYNFYFADNKFRCINQVNLHQEYTIYEVNLSSINEDTIVNDIITHITSLKIIQNAAIKNFTNIELSEFTNPF